MGNTALQNDKLPPMLRQYLEYKDKYPDALLLFQVGDFYELFFEDAVTVSKTLNLTLTSRDKNNPNPVPMCGVPIAVVDNYVDRLVDQSFSVAIVSQKTAGTNGKGMVARELERIITPGIRILSNAKSTSEGGLVASVYLESDSEVSFAVSQVQDGQIHVCENLSINSINAELMKLGPQEVVLPKMIEGREFSRRLAWIRQLDNYSESQVKFRSDAYLESSVMQEREFSEIAGYSSLASATKKAVRLLINYIDETTVSAQVPISKISVISEQDVLKIDATTRKNLELVKTVKEGGEQGSFLGYMNRTVSPGGYRLLRQWILNPLSNQTKILRRLDSVTALLAEPGLSTDLSELIKYLCDFERIAVRLELNIVSPRELAALRDSLEKLPEIEILLDRLIKRDLCSEQLCEVKACLESPKDLFTLLAEALVDSPPAVLSEGGMIRDEFNAELDRLKHIRKTGKSWIAQLEAEEKQKTGINSLKIKFNNVLGYFIEVTKANIARVPETYIRRQSMVNAERYTTEELKKREAEILGAKSRQIELERTLYEELKIRAKPFSLELRRIHQAVSELDVFVSYAILAEQEDFCRPKIDDSANIEIEAARHPILAKILQGAFVPNSLKLKEDARNCVILTGPNMGGKSTYLRQNALIVIMAQIGSFVPASSARIGIVDRIFARLGASDDMSEGESTFMVEMREASHILQNATSKSLVLIDEVGRGTATTDGLSIARAILEWIVEKISCRTLFATHFHELTSLEKIYPCIENLSVGSVDRAGDVVFTHEICSGAANKSYGIEVAKLAGLPKALLKRAARLLSIIDKEKKGNLFQGDSQLSIFDKPSAYNEEDESDELERLDELEKRIRDLDVNNMTPLEALRALDDIKKLL